MYLNVSFFRKQIQEINWRRKSEQTEAGNKLKELEDRYIIISKSWFCFSSFNFCSKHAIR